MQRECEDKIDMEQYFLPEMTLESLKSLLSIIKGCSDCLGCQSQIQSIEGRIAEMEGE